MSEEIEKDLKDTGFRKSNSNPYSMEENRSNIIENLIHDEVETAKDRIEIFSSEFKEKR